jgi:hypothetical protein
MNGRLIHTRSGVAALALAVLLVAGPVAAAFADGGPDRVAAASQTSNRPGFGDHIVPGRPGFGDRIPPRHRHAQAHPGPAAADGSTGAGFPVGTVTMAAIAVAIVGALVLAGTSGRRRRPARA